MRIYLAARYSRRQEMVGYAEQIQEAGHIVVARWLAGDHKIADSDLDGIYPEAPHGERVLKLAAEYAGEDLADIAAADLVIVFLEPQRSPNSRGGRLVEMGYAAGRGKAVWLVGTGYENAFCALPAFRKFETWADCLTFLRGIGPV